MLRCDYVARNSIAAIRLNGKDIPRSQAAAAKAATAAQENPASSSFTGACSRVISSPEPMCSRST